MSDRDPRTEAHFETLRRLERAGVRQGTKDWLSKYTATLVLVQTEQRRNKASVPAKPAAAAPAVPNAPTLAKVKPIAAHQATRTAAPAAPRSAEVAAFDQIAADLLQRAQGVPSKDDGSCRSLFQYRAGGKTLPFRVCADVEQAVKRQDVAAVRSLTSQIRGSIIAAAAARGNGNGPEAA